MTHSRSGTSSLFLGLTALLALGAALAEHSTTTITQKDAADLAADAEAKKRPQAEYVHDDLDKYQELHEANKRLRDPEAYLERLLSDELEKRASMRGFQGMRGKKSDYSPNSLDGPLAASLYGQLAQPDLGYYYGGGLEPAALDYYYDKRAPMGFQGMRGKKSQLDDELDKRAPMGFQGMRGKKSLEEVMDELEKRARMGFQGMRGKKAEEYEEQRQLAEEQQQQLGSIGGEWHKRAPMGFQGMRGRKNTLLDELDELEKRALLGFHGMRGKRDVQLEEEEPIGLEHRLQKRQAWGLVPQRSSNYNELEVGVPARYAKRSAYRLYGITRGKKNPRWELRGKFVGVRGKKWTEVPRPLANPNIYYAELGLVNSGRMAPLADQGH